MTTNKKPYPLRIPNGLLELAKYKSRDDRTSRATVLRQWLYTGAEPYVMDLISSGKLTLPQAASLLERNIYELQELAREHGIELEIPNEPQENPRQMSLELDPDLSLEEE